MSATQEIWLAPPNRERCTGDRRPLPRRLLNSATALRARAPTATASLGRELLREEIDETEIPPPLPRHRRESPKGGLNVRELIEQRVFERPPWKA